MDLIIAMMNNMLAAIFADCYNGYGSIIIGIVTRALYKSWLYIIVSDHLIIAVELKYICFKSSDSIILF